MKVMQVLPELNSGGVERGTLEVADFLVKQGHEAVVVSNGGRQVDALEALGARHITMPVHKKSLGSLFQVKPFRKLLEAEKPDILHIRSRVPGWIAYFAWKKMDPATRPRLVSTVHGFYSVNRYSAVMTKGESVIAVSESIKEYILKNFPQVPEGKIEVIHRGVSPEQFPSGFRPTEEWMAKWREDFPPLAGQRVILLPGRVTRWKGQEDFIRLVAALKAKGVEVHGLIVGETHTKKRDFEIELKALCDSCGVAEQVHFLGYRKDVREVMAVSDLVLSLSHEPEAFGRVSLEAMSLGKPVVAYDHGGVGEQLKEIFPEGLVKLGNEAAVLDCTLDILEKKARVGTIEQFTLQKMLDSTLGVYLRILATKKSQ